MITIIVQWYQVAVKAVEESIMKSISISKENIKFFLKVIFCSSFNSAIFLHDLWSNAIKFFTGFGYLIVLANKLYLMCSLAGNTTAQRVVLMKNFMVKKSMVFKDSSNTTFVLNKI